MTFALGCCMALGAQQVEPPIVPQSTEVIGDSGVQIEQSLVVNSTADDALTTSVLPSDDQVEEIEGATPLMQGPIHEAFAERFDLDDETPLVINREPPQAIEEQAPEYRPDGDGIEWIPGYWGWDIASEEFVWVSGVWRQVPPGQQWISGYWTQFSGGWRWVSGFWLAETNNQIVYLPPPPDSIDNGPSSPAPGPNYFWVTGYWVYGPSSNYVWHSGYWHACNNDWVWIPARYVWTPSGYVYRSGYWDFGVENRGMLFAPVAFSSGFNRVYRPSYVIETSPLLFANLYVSPGTSYYYFGSTYAYSSNRRCYPWVTYYKHGYDPLFSYYAYQQNQRNWLRSVSSIQHHIATNPNPHHHAGPFTVADQLRLHHDHGHLQVGPDGLPGPGGLNGPIGVGGSNGSVTLGGAPSTMLPVVSVAALALASQKKVDFKTPFSIKQSPQTLQNALATSTQVNEFARHRRELEKPQSAIDLANSKIPNATNGLNTSNPNVRTGSLKKIDLIKSAGGSGSTAIPRDFKADPGSIVNNSNGQIGNKLNGVTGSGNSLNGGITGGVSNANSSGGNAGSNPLNSASSGVVNNGSASNVGSAGSKRRSQIQAQQLSQILGENKGPLDTKQLEALRNLSSTANTGVNANSANGASPGGSAGGAALQTNRGSNPPTNGIGSIGRPGANATGLPGGTTNNANPLGPKAPGANSNGTVVLNKPDLSKAPALPKNQPVLNPQLNPSQLNPRNQPGNSGAAIGGSSRPLNGGANSGGSNPSSGANPLGGNSPGGNQTIGGNSPVGNTLGGNPLGGNNLGSNTLGGNPLGGSKPLGGGNPLGGNTLGNGSPAGGVNPLGGGSTIGGNRLGGRLGNNGTGSGTGLPGAGLPNTGLPGNGLTNPGAPKSGGLGTGGLGTGSAPLSGSGINSGNRGSNNSGIGNRGGAPGGGNPSSGITGGMPGGIPGAGIPGGNRFGGSNPGGSKPGSGVLGGSNPTSGKPNGGSASGSGTNNSNSNNSGNNGRRGGSK